MASSDDSPVRILESRIRDTSALVGVIGLGYVGLPLALAFVEKGFRVLGFDTDPAKVEKLARGECYIKHLDPTRLHRAIGLTPQAPGGVDGNSEFRIPNSEFNGGPGGKLRIENSELKPEAPASNLLSATSDFSRLHEPEAILICVPTPLGAHMEPDLGYVEASAHSIRDTLRTGQLVVLESTTYPGTTEELVLEILERPAERRAEGSRPHALECGRDFFLAFSPEREDPGNPSFGTTNTPKLVGGVDEVSADLAQALYDQIVERTVRVSSARVAEAAKLTENIFRSVNIALVNELKVIYDRLGIDVWEVLDAAETKPFGFMRFNPGPGLGGHCIIGSEWLRVRGCGLAGLYRAEELFRDVSRRFPTVVTKNGVFVELEGLEALALDAASGEVNWFPVTTLYRGRYEGGGCQITTDDKRRLIVTSEHPMMVLQGSGIDIVPARDLSAGDALPLVSDVGDACDNPVVDLLDVVPVAEQHRVWVRIDGHSWREHESVLKKYFGWTIRDSIRKDSLRLDRYLEIESELKISRESLVVMTGRGTARREWPAALEVTSDFARFLGYYLAEGCITVERNAARVRLTFNRDETEYIDDVRAILHSHGFPTSTYDDATSHSTTIKASSLLLVWLIDGAWRCGRGSEEMRVPDVFFRLSPEHKWHLLSGLLRGDGDVWVRTGKRTYTKNGRTCTHRDSTAQINFFSSSEVLVEQVVHLMQDLGIQPGFKVKRHHIRLAGQKTVGALIPVFDELKREKLEDVQNARRRTVTSRSDRPAVVPGVRSTIVASVDTAVIDGWVYSMEVDGAGAFTSSTGICVHNCIPLDPFYLAWRARAAGVPTRFIELAGEINHAMPGYVVDKLQSALNEWGKAVKGAKVLILGLAYKPNIDDPRESPAFEIIDRLLELGADVSYHDPHLPLAPRMRSWPQLPPMESVDLSPGMLARSDAVVIVTDHDAVDYELVIDHAQLIIDTRGRLRGRDGNVHPA